MEPTERSRDERPSDRGQGRREAPKADEQAPSVESLLRATAISLAVAVVILVIAVLPAEHGIDLTGIGTILGLTKTEAPAADVPGGDPVAIVARTEVPFNSDEFSVTLQPGEGAEVKIEMQAGERFVYEWTSAGGPVNFDMHGEGPHAGAQSTSYWAGAQFESDAGVFTAPITGTHGWFWRNRADGPVTVTLRTSGFYSRLFQAE